MNLQEFLATASTDDDVALTEAQAFEISEPRLYTADTMTMLLVGAGVYGLLTDTAVSVDHPVRDICLALMDRLRSEGEFNLSPLHPKGQANGAMLDALIAGLPDYSAELTGLKNQLLAGAVRTRYPFANNTLYDVLTLRDAVPGVSVEPNGQGFVLATSQATSPLHSPTIWGTNSRTNKIERVGVLRAVSEPGIYECRIGHEHRAWPLTLDNPYGVFV